MLVFNRLQSHKKQGWWNKFKSGGTNNLQAKRAEKIWTYVHSLHTTVQNFFLISLHLGTFEFPDFPWLLLIGTMKRG